MLHPTWGLDIQLSPSTTRPVADGLTWEHMLNLGWYGTEVDRGEPHAHRLPATSSVELSLVAGLGVKRARCGRTALWFDKLVGNVSIFVS